MPGIRRLTDKGRGVGIIDSTDSDQEEIAYCQRCLEMANVRSKSNENHVIYRFPSVRPTLSKTQVSLGKPHLKLFLYTSIN